jgi:hypothetical protein
MACDKIRPAPDGPTQTGPMRPTFTPNVEGFVVPAPQGYEESVLSQAVQVGGRLMGSGRIPIDRLDAIPDSSGIYAVFYEPKSPQAGEREARPPFLELLAAADLPLYLAGVDEPATIRERVGDIAELFDQARGLSWSWFRVAAVPMPDSASCEPIARLIEQEIGISPWTWMSFDRLRRDQYTEDSACTLVVGDTGFPSADERRPARSGAG